MHRGKWPKLWVLEGSCGAEIWVAVSLQRKACVERGTGVLQLGEGTCTMALAQAVGFFRWRRRK